MFGEWVRQRRLRPRSHPGLLWALLCGRNEGFETVNKVQRLGPKERASATHLYNRHFELLPFNLSLTKLLLYVNALALRSLFGH